MNGRKVFREYAKQLKNKQAKEFVRIEDKFYNQDTLITKDDNGNEEKSSINYKEMVHWIFKNYNLK
jgi:uncharacterized protein YdcH (DUF465 family)